MSQIKPFLLLSHFVILLLGILIGHFFGCSEKYQNVENSRAFSILDRNKGIFYTTDQTEDSKITFIEIDFINKRCIKKTVSIIEKSEAKNEKDSILISEEPVAEPIPDTTVPNQVK